MKEKTILTYIERCNDVVEKKMTRNAYAMTHDLSAGYFWNTWSKINKEFEDGNIPVDLFNKVVEALTKLDSSYAIYAQDGVKFGEEGDDDYTRIERDENGKITFYSFKICRKNKRPLIGKLTRDDMDVICRLYTYYGQGLTRRELSRYFPEWSLNDFKKILSVWGLQKDSSPLAQHTIEENSVEELLEIQARNKENDFIKKAEQQRIKATEKLLNKVQQENYELKQKLENKINIFKDLITKDYTEELTFNVNPECTEVGIIVLSDMHIGAYNEKEGYVPLENYNESEINRRLTKVLEYAYNSCWGSVIVLNLGDSVDSYNKQTTRGGHELPGIMSDKEMSNLYISCMMKFFNSLHKEFEDITYYCVGESNHDGNWGWINNLLLAEKLKNIGINSHISTNPIDNFDVFNSTFTYLHGKDIKNQFKGHPLTLNDKTTNWFTHYYADANYQFKAKKYILKGDLHQYAITKDHGFTYMSAPSMYGSSQYISANFGKTRWGVLCLTIDNYNNLSSGLVED